MRRNFNKRWLRAILWGLCLYLLLRIGEYVSPVTASTLPSTNAFLFLFGLGSALALLSPAQPRYRYR
jgi:hypothetical protein